MEFEKQRRVTNVVEIFKTSFACEFTMKFVTFFRHTVCHLTSSPRARVESQLQTGDAVTYKLAVPVPVPVRVPAPFSLSPFSLGLLKLSLESKQLRAAPGT